MQCSSCGKTISDGVAFCPYCRSAQRPAAQTSARVSAPPVPALGQGVALTFAAHSGAIVPSSPSQVAVNIGPTRPMNPTPLVLRPMDEDESVPEPGKARPLVILDEKFFYFADANADSPVSPEYLLHETERILAAQRVDVAVELRNTCWHVEPAHTRIRLVARLKDHRFSDFGIIAGVDYMGNWADLHLAVARELPVIPLPPEPPAPPEPQQQLPIVGLVLAAVGALGLFAGLLVAVSGSIGLGILAVFGGLLFLGLGIATWLSQQAAAKLRLAAARDEWERERERRKIEYAEQIRKDHLRSIAKYLIRNYPMDDMKLFCEAMVRVFAHVIRDIEKRGVRVTRESTTRGTFFGASAPSRTDAGDLGV